MHNILFLQRKENRKHINKIQKYDPHWPKFMDAACGLGTTSLESNIYDSIRDGAQSTGNLHTCESTINAKW